MSKTITLDLNHTQNGSNPWDVDIGRGQNDGVVKITFQSKTGDSITIVGLDSSQVNDLCVDMECLESSHEDYWDEYKRTGVPEDTPNITNDPMLTEK